MVTAQQLQIRHQLHGVPSIEKIGATAMTFGFASAVATVMDALDRLHTTATSHKRIMVLEVMGRHAGWIALHGGIAGGAHVILIPEIPFDYERIVGAIQARADRGHLSAIVVVAEGARPRDGQGVMRHNEEGETSSAELAASSRMRSRQTGKETRCTVLVIFTRRAPTTLDRFLARASASGGEVDPGKAIRLDGELPKLPGAPCAYRGGRESPRLVPPDGEMSRPRRDVDISFATTCDIADNLRIKLTLYPRPCLPRLAGEGGWAARGQAGFLPRFA